MNSTAAGVIISDGKVRSGQGNTLVVFGFLISNISRFLAVFNRTAGLLFKKIIPTNSFGFLISNISRFLAVFNRTAGLLFKKIIPTNSNDSLIYFKPSSNLNVLGW
jgi:hypothetical protein